MGYGLQCGLWLTMRLGLTMWTMAYNVIRAYNVDYIGLTMRLGLTVWARAYNVD